MSVMREKLQRFMMGRYGADEMSKALSVSVLVCLLLSLLSGFLPIFSIFYWLGLGAMIYSLFRMFSKNVSKRSQENQQYLNFRYRAVAKKDAAKKRWAQRGEYCFYKCPGCKQRVRVPRGKGKICITCPKCKTEFIKRT